MVKGYSREAEEPGISVYRNLGMDRAITRRDFINGVAAVVGAGAALDTASSFAAQSSPTTSDPASNDAASYPPLRQGLRGNIPSAVDVFKPMEAGRYVRFPVSDQEIQEEYDLVIVGAGISGLSAAHFYRLGLGPKHSILILESHDDFGGHAKRN